MRVVLLGPPGAGKGTLAGLLKESSGIFHISTGDILREEIKNETKLGKEAKGYIDSGDLVPDKLVITLIENKITKGPDVKNGFMFDGFPRTRKQAEDLDMILKKIGKPIEFAFYMEASMPMILKRLTGRRVCRDCGAVYHIVNRPPKKKGVCDSCGGNDLYQRPDDNEGTIKNRLDVYLKNTLPIVDYYKDKKILKKINGDLDSEELEAIILSTCNESANFNKHKK